MILPEPTDRLITEIAAMNRPALLAALLDLDRPFAGDFTPEYLAGCDDDRLRHILLAARLVELRPAARRDSEGDLSPR